MFSKSNINDVVLNSVVHKYAKGAQKGIDIEEERRQKFEGDFHFFGEKANEKHVGRGKHDRHAHKCEYQIFQREKRKYEKDASTAQNHKIEHGRKNMFELHKARYCKHR